MAFSALRMIGITALIAAPLALPGCASGPAVQTQMDRTANFAGYKSFGFEPVLGTDRGGARTALSRYLVAAASREMIARGLVETSTAPDLLINFNANVSDKVRIDSTPMPMGPPMGMGVGMGARGGYYGYRGGMYGTWGNYSQTTATQYTQGTLNIDVVDAGRKQLVWEGVVTKTITEKSAQNLEATVDGAVAAAFAKFPLPVK
jgi:hypothetical protein